VHDFDSRSESLKRKHLSTEVEHGAETNNGSLRNPSAATHEAESLPSFVLQESDDESHSQKALDETRFCDAGLQSPDRDDFPVLERNWTSISSDANMFELNQNVFPLSSIWVPMCPNVSLAGLDDGMPSRDRVTSFGSSSEFGEANDLQGYAMVPRLSANVLVVSHGGFISQLISHFRDEHKVPIPSTVKPPNAGLSRFLVSIMPCTDDAGNRNDPALVSVQCIVLHDKDHLANDVDTEPLPTSEPF